MNLPLAGPRSQAILADSRQRLPGGVNSPVRACTSVGCDPFVVASASGSRVTDVDGNTYIDYIGSWGPMILGHAQPEVVAAVQEAAARGTSYGAPTELELKLSQRIGELYPPAEMVRLVNSGTEATMHALRLARAFTNRPRILKFAGCYHGASDSLLVRAGSGVETLGLPDSPGVPEELAALTLTAHFNDLDSVETHFRRHPDTIACVILEPVVGNMGVIPPAPGFLEGLRALCDKHGALLVFDEVMTGFRIAPGGAAQRYGVSPDLVTLGKIVGGGLPVGAFAGRREIMALVAPAGPVYQAGTLSGNPLAMAAGIVTLEQLMQPGVYEQLEDRSARLADGLQRAADEAGLPTCGNRVGSMLCLFFTAGPVTGYDEAKAADTERFAAWYRALRQRGIALAPSQYEAAFVSLAHTDEDIAITLDAAREAFRSM